jgi:hypothetical protein
MCCLTVNSFLTNRVGNPRVGNPRVGNPRVGNPRVGNPRVGNPRVGNPRVGNPPLVINKNTSGLLSIRMQPFIDFSCLYTNSQIIKQFWKAGNRVIRFLNY